MHRGSALLMSAYCDCGGSTACIAAAHALCYGPVICIHQRRTTGTPSDCLAIDSHEETEDHHCRQRHNHKACSWGPAATQPGRHVLTDAASQSEHQMLCEWEGEGHEHNRDGAGMLVWLQLSGILSSSQCWACRCMRVLRPHRRGLSK